MFGSFDDGLDDAQRRAVTHGDGPLVVVAGAGTGKTRTITARVARLLERGVPPERILLLTFTRRAAEEMISRASTLVERPDVARRLRGGTFHAVAHQLIRPWSQTLGIGENFSVLDPADAADVMAILREENGLSGTAERFPKPATLVDIYSRCVNTRHPLGAVVGNDFPWCTPHLDTISALCRAYVERKRARHQLDFDDLLLYWNAALRAEAIGGELAAMFDHVLVDEYQDVNALQVEIVQRLCPDGHGLTVVGDDAQAIYGFRGAHPGYLQDLAATLPTASVIKLETNFRSCQPILDLANHARPVSGTAQHARLTLRAERTGGRRPRLVRCYDANAEARQLVDTILERHEHGTRLREQAVLVRAAHHSDLIELELTARRVPFRKYGGLRFLEAAHVKDFIAAARLLDNPADDIAWFRLLRLHEGIGPARARQLLAALGPDPGLVDDWTAAVAAAPPAARVPLSDTFTSLAETRARVGTSERAERIAALLAPLVRAHYHDAAARVIDLERLAAAADAHDDFSQWLSGLTLDPPSSTSDHAGPPEIDEDYVTLSTVHSAKGLEWPIVHLPHLVDGAFPSDMALRSADGIAEEQRLFYVAITRARDELLLYCPHRMPHHRVAGDDRHSLALQSRFLDDGLLTLLTIDEVARLVPARPATALDAARLPAIQQAVATAVDLGALWA